MGCDAVLSGSWLRAVWERRAPARRVLAVKVHGVTSRKIVKFVVTALRNQISRSVFSITSLPPLRRLLLPLLLTTYLWGSGGAITCILILSSTRREGSASSLGRCTKGIGTPVSGT